MTNGSVTTETGVPVVSLERGKPDQLVMWDAWHTRHTADDRSSLHEECREALLRALPPPDHSGPVLELGCGQGFDAIPIGKAGYTVIAVDFSATALSIALQRLAACGDLEVSYQLRDISLPLPYPERAFSGIFS